MSETKNDIFEEGTRKRVRFASTKGLLSIEDVWTIPLKKSKNSNNVTDIDDIAKSLSAQLKETEIESFVEDVITAENTLLKLKFDIIKHIIKVRKAERDAAENRKSVESQINKYDRIIARKEDEKLDSSSIEDIKKLRDALK